MVGYVVAHNGQRRKDDVDNGGVKLEDNTLVSLEPGGEFPEVTVDRQTWTKIIDAAQSVDGCETLPPVECLLAYGVDPESIFDSFTWEVLDLYVRLGGTSRLSRPDEYYDLSAVWVDASAVIDDELAKIKRAKK